MYDVKVAIVPQRDVKVAIVRGSAEPRGLTLKDATRGGLGEREEDNDRRQCAVNSVSEQRQAACVIQRSIEPSGNPPSPLHHVNHARARLLRQAAPLEPSRFTEGITLRAPPRAAILQIEHGALPP